MSNAEFVQTLLLAIGVVGLFWLFYCSFRDHGGWDYVIEQDQEEFIGRSDSIIITYVWRKGSVVYKDFAVTLCIDKDVVLVSERDKAQQFITSQRGR